MKNYFPSISVELYDWVRNPFVEYEITGNELLLKEEEELAFISRDRRLKMEYLKLNIDSFWLFVKKEYPIIAKKALRVFVQFSTTYLCDSSFSALTNIKHKKRANLLYVEQDLRLFLLRIRPNITELCKRLQPQPSH